MLIGLKKKRVFECEDGTYCDTEEKAIKRAKELEYRKKLAPVISTIITRTFTSNMSTNIDGLRSEFVIALAKEYEALEEVFNNDILMIVTQGEI